MGSDNSTYTQLHTGADERLEARSRTSSSAPPRILSANDSFLSAEVNLDAAPVGPEMAGYDLAARGPFPILFTPCVREILDIDTVEQRATLVIDVCMDWIDDGILEHDGKEYQMKASDTSPQSIFRPQLIINNLIEELTERTEMLNLHYIRGRPVLSEYWSQIVTVRCLLDLRQFPFDSQQIGVTFVSNYWDSAMLEYVVVRSGQPSSDLADGVFLDPDVAAQSCPCFKFTGACVSRTDRDYAYLRHYSDMASEYSIVKLSLHCKRDPTYYLYRIVAVLLMVMLLKMCTILNPLEDYNTKMGWDGGLFLTLVAFNYIVANEVPKVTYVTRIDKLITSTSILMSIDIVVEVLLAFLASSIIPESAETLELINTVRALVYLSGLTVATVWFFSIWSRG